MEHFCIFERKMERNGMERERNTENKREMQREEEKTATGGVRRDTERERK